MKFNKLCGMLKNAFNRLDQEDLWTSLKYTKSELLEVKEEEVEDEAEGTKSKQRFVRRIKEFKVSSS